MASWEPWPKVLLKSAPYYYRHECPSQGKNSLWVLQWNIRKGRHFPGFLLSDLCMPFSLGLRIHSIHKDVLFDLQGCTVASISNTSDKGKNLLPISKAKGLWLWQPSPLESRERFRNPGELLLMAGFHPCFRGGSLFTKISTQGYISTLGTGTCLFKGFIIGKLVVRPITS